MGKLTTSAEVGDLESAELVECIRSLIEISCEAVGISLLPKAIANIYWMKAVENPCEVESAAMLSDYDLRSLKGRSNADLAWREIGFSDEAELLRADKEGWTSFGFSVLPMESYGGCEVHFGLLPWAESVLGESQAELADA